MNKRIYRFAIGLMFSVLFVLGGCKEAPKYGSMEGLWQILSIVDSDGTELDCPGRRYFAFQANVVQLRRDSGAAWMLEGNFFYEKPEIYMDFPYAKNLRNTEEQLAEWGFESDVIRLTVTEQTKSRLVMHNAEGRTWTCRKF